MAGRYSPSGWPPPREIREEPERDQIESSFTRPLRRTVRCHSSVLAALFVDAEGECVDYCSCIDPYDAKVAGAQMQVSVAEVRRFARRIGGGRSALTEVVGERRCFVLREIGDGYSVVVVIQGRLIDQAILVATEKCASVLRAEAGLATPSWDPKGILEVITRDAVGWDYAPLGYVEHGIVHKVQDVLGRWEEDGGISAGSLVCFRVRNEAGDELTLAHDDIEKAWLRW